MLLRDIFEKPVDRKIEGVIKADDEASLRTEIEEYVLTDEVKKRLEDFLDAYNNLSGANGVWISGFFGSGKSHLLKMLALVLENRVIDSTPVIELLAPKCADNEILRADLQRAAAIPSRSILFNIDQKADVISKTQIDALLSVFVKVFDEMFGYYGKVGHIAQFERDLDSRGQYADFQSVYQDLTGRSWQQGREHSQLESKIIAKAYARITGEEEGFSEGIIEKYRSQYRLSIEDFAEMVNAYISRQEPGFRLNFLVDEVGQFIAENVKLMTNLQTIAESLSTRCRGQAWILVTAQEDLNTVTGEMTRLQGNDFSKIQARFAIRMKLTSTNVDEVIQKRLLLKNDHGIQNLTDIHHRESNNFKTLFDFTDGSISYKNFQDRDHFIHSYPFIPYQFSLFQTAIENLSAHNAFEGRHSSVGERSMLGVFQEVAKRIGDHHVGQLATFDLMYEGIRTALKSNIQKAVLQAEQQLDNPLAIKLLKALLLVKYVRGYKASLRNLCILMLESFQVDLPQFRKEVEAALDLLEQQTYIQRNAELYEYLTDEEKDVEQEIKNTEVEIKEVMAELEKLIFDNILKDRKIRYDSNGQDYAFTRIVDDRAYNNRDSELAIHVISPFHDQISNHDLHRMDTVYREEVRVLMSPDPRLMQELMMYKRSEKYIQQNITITQQESVKQILSNKSLQNQERYRDIEQRLQTMLGQSRLFVAGFEKEFASHDPKSRIISGFRELITHTYPNLAMLKGISYSENDIGRYLEQLKGGVFEGDHATLTEAEQEMFAFIQSNARGAVRTTIKSLMDKFERKPYGWYYAARLCILASLYARGKLELRADGHLLENDKIEKALRNSHGHAHVVLDPQTEFTASQVRGLKTFYGEFFGEPARATEAKALGIETGTAFEKLLNELNQLAAQKAAYPFLNSLTPVLATLKDCTGKPYTWYLSELTRQNDTLLDMREDSIDPIRKFMGCTQKTIYDQAKAFVQNQNANFTHIENDEVTEVKNCLNDPECFKGNHMQRVKTLIEGIELKLSACVQAEIASANESVSTLENQLTNMAEFTELNKAQQEQILQPFKEFSAGIAREELIAVIRDRKKQFEDKIYPRQLSELTYLIQKAAIQEPAAPESPPEPRIEYVNRNQLSVPFSKVCLADENDVDQYLKSLRTVLLHEIQKGQRIII